MASSNDVDYVAAAERDDRAYTVLNQNVQKGWSQILLKSIRHIQGTHISLFIILKLEIPYLNEIIHFYQEMTILQSEILI